MVHVVQIVVWVTLCAALELVFVRRPLVTPVVAVTIAVLVPYVATEAVMGESKLSGVHPATWLIAVAFAARFVLPGSGLRTAIVSAPLVPVALGVVGVGAIAFSVLTGRYGGAQLAVNQIIAPVVLFLIVRTVVQRPDQPAAGRRFARFLVLLAAGEAAFALLQWVQGSVLVYEQYYRTYTWFNLREYPRYMGTLDHPLTLAFLIAMVVPLVPVLRRRVVVACALAVLLVGVAVTQSRVGLILAVVGCAAVLLRARTTIPAKVLTVAAVGALVAVAAEYTPLVTDVLRRFSDDQGSSTARAVAWEFLSSRWSEYILVGQGLGSSYAVAAGAGLRTSLENAFLMYAVDLGLVLTVVYFGLQYRIVAQAVADRQDWTYILAALVACVVPHSYSSLATESAAGVIVWSALALAATRASAAPRAVDGASGRRQHSLAEVGHLGLLPRL